MDESEYAAHHAAGEHLPGLGTGNAVRFCLDYFRHIDTDVRHFGLTPAQYFSIGIALLGLSILRRRKDIPQIRGEWTPESTG